MTAPSSVFTRPLLELRQKKDEPEDHAIGRSCGGPTTKIMIAGERNILGLSVEIVAGQVHESKHFVPVLSGISIVNSDGKPVQPDIASGDKAFSSDAIRQHLAEQDIIAVIPYKSNEHGASLPFDSERYKDRNVIERLFGRMKECRRVATRYEKYALTYLSMVLLSLIRLML